MGSMALLRSSNSAKPMSVLGSGAGIAASLENVCFTTNNGHGSAESQAKTVGQLRGENV